MKVLMLSTDSRMLEEKSPVSLRLKSYGALIESLVVLLSGGSLREARSSVLSEKVRIYSVVPLLKFLRPFALVFKGLRLRQGNFSLVTAQDPFETGLAGVFLSKLLGVPLEVQIHTDFLNPFFLNNSFLNRLRALIASFVLHHAHSIRTVSERISKSVRARYGISKEKINVLPVLNASRDKHSSSANLKERFPQFSSFSVAVSRFEPEKNVSALLEAFAVVARTEDSAALIILGDGGERGALVTLSRNLGIEKNVVFDGWQDPTPYLVEADLFVQNSLYEGYGLTLIEAAEAGCPILTTDVGIVGEVFTEENASVVQPRDTRAFARAWQTALENPQFMREKAERALEAVKRHASLSPEVYAEAIVGLWHKACAGDF